MDSPLGVMNYQLFGPKIMCLLVCQESHSQVAQNGWLIQQ